MGSIPGCGRSNSGSIPGILPNVVHTVKPPRTVNGNLGRKQLKKKKISEEQIPNPGSQAYPTEHGHVVSLSQPPPRPELTTSPLAQVKICTSIQSLLIGVVLSPRADMWGQLPTLVIMACQHPWA